MLREGTFTRRTREHAELAHHGAQQTLDGGLGGLLRRQRAGGNEQVLRHEPLHVGGQGSHARVLCRDRVCASPEAVWARCV